MDCCVYSTLQNADTTALQVAVEGCGHGDLDNIYATIKEAEQVDGLPVELLLICGDFEAIRNHSDLHSMAVPEKYRHLADFHRYYSGEKVAPMLTIVIGGNHEASNYNWELFHGGWFAPKIYYLGAAGSVLVNGMRISGASGIYKGLDYRKGRFERMPYDRSTLRSVYHTRQYDIDRLSKLALLGAWPTIVLSHDWPNEIEKYGDTAGLLRYKPYFRDEVNSGTLGSPPLRTLLETLRPAYWFSAHLHVKFAALFKHDAQATLLNGTRAALATPQQNGHRKRDTGWPKLPADGDKAVTSESAAEQNPDELAIDDEDLEDANAPAQIEPPVKNADEIAISDDEQDIVGQPDAPAGTADNMPTDTVDESVTVLEIAGESVHTENPDAIRMSDEEDFEEPSNSASTLAEKAVIPSFTMNIECKATKFLALSKCLPGQNFLQILDIPISTTESASPPKLTFDPVWLAITRAFHPLLSLNVSQPALPANPAICKAMIDKELQWIQQNAPSNGQAEIASVLHFQQTAPCVGQPGGDDRHSPGPWYTNPQTEAFCAMIGVQNKINPVPTGHGVT